MKQLSTWTKVYDLANRMFDDQQTISLDGWPDKEVTFFYLDTADHLLYANERGFGMKKSITHKKGYVPDIEDLACAIRKDWGN